MKKFFYNILLFFVRLFCRIFFRMKVNGKENFPKDGALIFCANHTSNWDLVFLFSFLPREVRFMAKKEIFSWFFIGSLARFLGAFPVNRGKPDLKAIRFLEFSPREQDLKARMPRTQKRELPYLLISQRQILCLAILILRIKKSDHFAR